MAQEIGVDGAVPDGQSETRGEDIFKLHPEEFGVWFFVWHWFRSWKRSLRVEELKSARADRQKKRQRLNTEGTEKWKTSEKRQLDCRTPENKTSRSGPGREKPAGLLPCSKKKASSAEPGRTFLQH